jgi:hypothetical protein
MTAKYKFFTFFVVDKNMKNLKCSELDDDSDLFNLSCSTRCGWCSYQVSSISVQRVTCYDHFCVFQFFSILAVSMATAAILKIPEVVCTSTLELWIMFLYILNWCDNRYKQIMSNNYVPQTKFGRHIVFVPFLIIILLLLLSFFHQKFIRHISRRLLNGNQWNFTGMLSTMSKCADYFWNFQNGRRCHGNSQNAKKLKNTKMIITGYSPNRNWWNLIGTMSTSSETR